MWRISTLAEVENSLGGGGEFSTVTQVKNSLGAGGEFSWSRWRILHCSSGGEFSWSRWVDAAASVHLAQSVWRPRVEQRPNQDQTNLKKAHITNTQFHSKRPHQRRSRAHQRRCTQKCWSRETREREGALKRSNQAARGRLYIPGLDLTTPEKGKILNLWRFLRGKEKRLELGHNQIHETENHFRYRLLLLRHCCSTYKTCGDL